MLFLNRTFPVLRWGVSGWVRCDVDWIHEVATLVPVVEICEVDEGRRGWEIGVDGVRCRDLELILVGESNLFLFREFDESVGGDEFGRALPTGSGFRIQREF